MLNKGRLNVYKVVLFYSCSTTKISKDALHMSDSVYL